MAWAKSLSCHGDTVTRRWTAGVRIVSLPQLGAQRATQLLPLWEPREYTLISDYRSRGADHVGAVIHSGP